VTGHIALYGKKIIVLENISKERVLINFWIGLVLLLKQNNCEDLRGD
jgi:hypothetical protein